MTDVQTLKRRVEAIQARMVAAARRAGRDPADVALLAVSKTRPAEAVAAVVAGTGMTRFAENRPQELAAKARELSNIEWVLIGPLQTNKAGLAAEFACQFQALDAVRTAEALDRRLQALGRGMDVLIEVNTSGETAKHGVPPEGALELAHGLKPFSSLRPVGLMTVAVNSPDEVAVRACFRRLRGVQDQLRDELGDGWGELSMGMSGDFEWAIEEGSTIVRVGTAIFGPRPMPRDVPV